MNKPKTNSIVINELCGGDIGLLRAAHHGLNETPLGFIYPSLDLKEVVAFSAASFVRRESQDPMVQWKAQIESLYDLFNYNFKFGMPWVNKHMGISEKNSRLFMELNPFEGKNLRERLAEHEYSPETKLFVERFERPTKIYLSEAQYQRAKRIMDENVDFSRVEVMGFQPVNMRKSKKVADNYALEISRKLNGYSEQALQNK